MAIWFGMFLLSVTWLFLVPIYVPTSIAWLAFFASGVSFIIWGFRAKDAASDKNSYDHQTMSKNKGYNIIGLWPLMPLLITAVIAPLEWKLASLLLSGGIISLLLEREKHYISRGLLLSGATILIQSAVVQLYWKIGPRLQEESVFDGIASFTGNIFGMKSSLTGSTLFINNPVGYLPYLSTLDKFGIFFLILLFSGSLCILLFLKSNKRLKILKAFAVIFIYGIVRYILILAMLTDDGHVDIFWSMPIMAITMVFIPVFLNKVLPLREARFNIDCKSFIEVASTKKIIAATVLACLAFCGIAAGSLYNEPGVKKDSRVIVDEKHSDWEWTDKVYDTQWFGEQSNYNYYCLYDYLSHYYDIRRNYNIITDDLLSGCGILILKTPTSPFEKSEVDSIARFVNNGGSVFMIGDHTNVFGISTNFNTLASRFGFKYRYDATYDLSTGALTEYEKPGILPHPVVQNIPKFLFATSCSIDAPVWTEDIITGYSMRAVEADYSQDNFFPEDGNSLKMRTGLLLQAIGIRYGKGRVVALADSTPFSNFWMFMKGKPELILGIMEWLDRYNSFPTVSTVSLIMGCMMLFALMMHIRKKKRREVVFIICAGIFAGGLLSSIICTYANAENYKTQGPKTPYATVSYESQYSDYSLPVNIQGFMAPYDRQLSTFYIWNQRVGLVPHYSDTMREAIGEGNIIVVVNPRAKIDPTDAQKLKDSIAGGKKLLLMGSDKDEVDAFNSFAKLFGIELLPGPAGRPTAYYGDGKSVILTEGTHTLKGGSPLIKTGEGSVVGCEVEFGEGKVMTFSDARLFYNLNMGIENTIPDEYQRTVDELEFWMLKHLSAE